jgi:signal transduction histidine kinase
MAEVDQEANTPNLEIDTETVRSTSPVRLLVTLRNGKIMMLEARRPLSERFNGVRLGFLALAITVFISVVSLWIIRNQLRPLERLAKAVEKFGSRLETSQLPEEGSSELRQLIGAFNRLQSNMGDLIAGRTRIISAVGHDIGTYLTRLRLRVEYIGETSQREKAIRDIEDMNSLMRETLSLAQLNHIEAVPIDVVALLKKQVSIFSEHEGPVRYEGTEEPYWVVATGLERALSNLIYNALRYGKEALLRVEQRASDIHITVEDRGPGIPLEEREAVLEPFYRLDIARNLNERGFGLGLAIVSEVVKTADGMLFLEDREGGGLRVRMVFPLAQTDTTND